MAYTHKPTTREGIIIFGDGDEAALIACGKSTYEGFIYFKMKPTPQMKWRKQISHEDYHPDDQTLNKIYKQDLCIQLSIDPDFPMWIILSDYYGIEDTPLMETLVRCTHLIKKNRDIVKENKTLWATVNSMRKKARRKAEHPSEDEREKLNFLQHVTDRTKSPVVYPPSSDMGEDQT